MKNREALKSVIKKLILQEVSTADFGSRKQVTNTGLADEWDKALKSAAGKEASVLPSEYRGVFLFDDGHGGNKFVVEVTSTNDRDLAFDVRAIFHSSDRFYGKGLDRKDILDFIKKHLAKDQEGYVDMAYNKSIKALGRDINKDTNAFEKEKEEDAKDFDKMTDAKEDKQVDIAKEHDKKAEEKFDKAYAPIDKDNSLQLGGTLVDKIEKIIDKALQKKVNLKFDKKLDSPDDIVVKLDGTNQIKASKSKPYEKPYTPDVKDVDLKKSDVEKTKVLKAQKKVNEGMSDGRTVPVFCVYIPANVYDGKYYDYQTYRMIVPITDEVKTEQDAIKWVNTHKQDVLAIADKSRVSGRRRIKSPIEKNLFFKDRYTVSKSQVTYLN